MSGDPWEPESDPAVPSQASKTALVVVCTLVILAALPAALVVLFWFVLYLLIGNAEGFAD